jgi:hypothetical protein
MTSSSLVGMECNRFLKYWLSSIFQVQSLTISLQQLELGPDDAEGHTSLPQLNGCHFDLICVVFGGGLGNLGKWNVWKQQILI